MNKPDNLVDFLANSLPAQSSYFIQIVIVAMVFNMGMELLRVYPLGMALLRKVMTRVGFPDPEEIKLTKGYFRPLDDPYEFEHAKVLANTVVLYFMVLFVYTVVSPLSNFFLAVCFLMMESGFRYQFYHNYPAIPDSGGELWKGFIHMIHTSMIIAQLTLIGLLLLKKSFYAVSGLGPLLAITFVFIYYTNTSRFKVTKHLPSRECVSIDRKNQENGGVDFSFARQQYLQPSIRTARKELDRITV